LPIGLSPVADYQLPLAVAGPDRRVRNTDCRLLI
jgi:hypothetical protein